jgi:hypothetical protein
MKCLGGRGIMDSDPFLGWREKNVQQSMLNVQFSRIES